MFLILMGTSQAGLTLTAVTQTIIISITERDAILKSVFACYKSNYFFNIILQCEKSF